MLIEEIKTSSIGDNPDNPRQKLGDLRGLMKSIQSIGLQQPISVRKVSTSKFIVVAGARRLAACKKLGLSSVTCVVRTQEETHELASIAENTARVDLSSEELADALDRLEGLEMSDKEIADALAIAEGNLPAARVVAKATKKDRSKVLALAGETRQFTLEESATMLKYIGDEGRLAQIADELEYSPEQLPHLLARFDAQDALAKELADLRESMKGATEIAPFHSDYQRPPKGAEPLHNLAASDGKPLTEKSHQTCPYVAFTIEGALPFDHQKPAIVHYCSDWESAGHKLGAKPKQVWRGEPAGSSEKSSGKMNDKKLAERREVVANNKLWGPASTVRTTWIEEFTERKELNQVAKQWVLSELMQRHDLVNAPLFVKGSLSGAQTFDRGFVIVWRQLVQAREEILSKCTWRPGSYWKDVMNRYFTMLQVQGYPVSEVESLLILKKAVKDAA